jgi:hypothetical protein
MVFPERRFSDAADVDHDEVDAAAHEDDEEGAAAEDEDGQTEVGGL